MKRTDQRATTVREVVRLSCACANLRRAARVMTRLYDAALRPSGLSVAQFTLLQALNTAPGMSQKQLASLLEVDSTTLTRTLQPLRRAGWLRSTPGDDRREVHLALTAAGKRAYGRALPYWERAQDGFVRALGRESWNRLMELCVRTAGIQ
jgi:DNA-binding MarR family transcriptional regulator